MSTEETRPLLARNQDGNNGSGRPRSRFSKVSWSPVTLIIPVALASRLAVQLPQTTALYLIQQLICREYFLSTDPQKVPPPPNPMPDELCSADGVKQWYSLMLTVLGVVGGLCSVVGYQVVNHFASRYGRRPVMIGVVLLALSSNLFLITSPWMSPVLEIVWLILWQLCESLSSVLLVLFLVNLYILDTVDAESRTAALSTLNGWAILGDAVSFIVGGNITTYTRRALPVYYVAVSIHVLNFLYLVFVLPESFTQEKRDELKRERIEEASRRAAILSQLPTHKRLFCRLSTSLGSLQILKPSRNEGSGRRNWRLLICAAHVFTVTLGAGYTTLAMVTFLTSKYNYKPADTGYLLAIYSLTASLTMTFAIPQLLKLLRPLYRRLQRGEDLQSLDDDDNSDDVANKSTDRLDVHVTVSSWVVEACGFLLVSHTTTRFGQYASGVVVGLSAARSPVFRSLVAASVEPLKQGEALAAIEMVASVAMFISPILMGTILTETIVTMPALVFWINAVLVLSGSAILLLVRESDRYQRAH